MVRLQRRGSDARSWSDKLLQRRAARKQDKVAPNGRHCAAMLARMRGRHRAGDFAAPPTLARKRCDRQKPGWTADDCASSARRFPVRQSGNRRRSHVSWTICHALLPHFVEMAREIGRRGAARGAKAAKAMAADDSGLVWACGADFLPANAPVRKTRMVKRVTMKGDPTTGGICRRLRRDRVSIGERIDLGRGL